MNRLPTEKRAQILSMMVEGVSIRSIARLTGCSKNTIAKLLKDAGEACLAYQDQAFRDLPCKRIQVNEIWSFVYAKAKKVSNAKAAPEIVGNVWTWTAICSDTKLVPSWLVGRRDGRCAMAFLDDLAKRLASRVQLISDGHRAYLETLEGAFSGAFDHAMLVEIYGAAPEGEMRCSPAECLSAYQRTVEGNLDKNHISTSHAGAQNLSSRMGKRRFARLSDAFSKKLENHIHALSIYFMHYNFVRQHSAHCLSPVMAAGVADTLWSIEDIVRIVDEWEIEKR